MLSVPRRSSRDPGSVEPITIYQEVAMLMAISPSTPKRPAIRFGRRASVSLRLR
jgi:hypothetical protein